MLTTLPASAPHEAIFEQIEKDGGVIVSDLLSRELVDRLWSDFEPLLGEREWGNADSSAPDPFFGATTKRLHGLLSKSQHMAEVVAHPLLLAMADHRLALGERCQDYHISTLELMCIGPGEVTQRLHRDIDAWPHLPYPTPRPETLISANIALHDFTEENGATVVFPGSHKWPQERRALPEEQVQAVMSRGSALLYSGEILHGGGDNRTEAQRCGLYVGYIAGWLNAMENHLLTNQPEDIFALPERTQRLFGVVPSGFSLLV